jgi:hypothetical protein
MEALDFADWALWPLFAYAVATALESWAKLQPESLPIIQRFLSFLLAIISFPFGIGMLWRAHQMWGLGHAVKAFFIMWLGMLLLNILFLGGYLFMLKIFVREPEDRVLLLQRFRYGRFWPAIFAAAVFGYKLFYVYP